MSFRQSFFFTLLVGIVVATSFLVGFWTREQLSSQTNYPILQEAQTLLLEHGLKTPPPGRSLEYGMVRGMLQAYGDPFTSFSEPAQAELQSNLLQGSFGGIGANLGRDLEGFHILYPFPASPAAGVGILEADRLLAIDGNPVTPDLPVDTIQAGLRGEVGSTVTLTLGRAPAYSPFTVSIQRANFSLPSVTWNLELRQPLLGVVKINLIASTTPDEIQKAVSDLKARGATHFVLDLRDNYGGLLDSGVQVAQLFLKEGNVIQVEFKNQQIITHEVSQPGPLIDLPLVLLVNQNTASSAEIIAGALQARGRALLIGSPTFGKDTLQVVFLLQDQSSIQITSGHWWVPGIDLPRTHQGLRPDYIVDPATGDPDPVLLKAIEILFPSK